MSATDLLFCGFSAVGLIFALFVVLGKNPISSAFSLVVVFFCVAADYALMQAHLMAAAQVLVYAGAIMVLFVFVIMLLNADVKTLEVTKSRALQVAAGVLCLGTFGMVMLAIKRGTFSATVSGLTPDRVDALGGNVQVVSELMFSDYILPFELTSVLLLVAIVGSVSLAKRKSQGSTQK